VKGLLSSAMFSRTRSARLPWAPLGAPALMTAAALAAILAGCGGGHTNSSSSSSPSSTSTANGGSGFDGAALPGVISAPTFTLRDQAGREVSLHEYRGRVVALAFLYSTCGGPCVLIAQQIRGALDELEEAHAHPPAALIVSADPAADTPARVKTFLAQTSLSDRAHYLTGSLSQLKAVWRAYHVRPASSGPTTFTEYASVLLIDPQGDERVLFQSEQLTPEGISHDIRKLQSGG
jgi:protein SCO1